MGSDPFTEMLQAPPKRNEVVMGSDPITRQTAMFAAETDAQTVMAFIAVRSAMREISVLVLFVSKALTFLSLGGFWKNALLVQNREQPVQDTEQSLES